LAHGESSSWFELLSRPFYHAGCDSPNFLPDTSDIDSKHTREEERFFCIGKVEHKIITVRFTYREGKIRIFGAGYWRKGKVFYEKND